ncbi:MAG: glucose-1-phosphate thymidylyltransferase [Firmicutes bacterium HGW-Firmicutes-1]|jgi:glucose-1-phosphate thymidylyltransferase|nr:MAG: glucose-1-phosphate thymidylyltransferase [Firmicutes bacterium HGW-Firmicutes-1]
MKGIILVNGSEPLLFPITKALSKHILPIYDKPFIYYELYIMMMSNIKQIQIMLTPTDTVIHQQLLELLGDGSSLGIQLTYKIHEQLKGIAELFLLEKNFIDNESVALLLGNTLLLGEEIEIYLNSMDDYIQGAFIFEDGAYNLAERIALSGKKPKELTPDLAIPGIYFYDNSIVEIVHNLKSSLTSGLEIMDINQVYHAQQKLKVIRLEKGSNWFDTSTCIGLIETANFVSEAQKTNGYYIGCIEEIAYKKGYISYEQLQLLAKPLNHTEYGKYLENIAKRQWEWES